MKRIVNFLLVGSITYSLSMWVFVVASWLSNANIKDSIQNGIIISTILAVAAAFYVWFKMRNVKYEVSFTEKNNFINALNNKVQELGFEPKTAKENKFKYKSFVWFSLMDPNLRIRVKDDKAILKGRKNDLDSLVSHLSNNDIKMSA